MRTVVVIAAAVVFLASCTTPSESSGDVSASPTASSAAAVADVDLQAICDAVSETVALPGGDTVAYTGVYHAPTGAATNVPICGIEPEGAYADVAAASGEFGRAEFDYGTVTAEQARTLGYLEYTSATAEQLLTGDETVAMRQELPCASEACEDGIHGYMYRFGFATVTGDVVVIAQFDYITTSTSGEREPAYRSQAIEAFTAAMGAVIAQLP